MVADPGLSTANGFETYLIDVENCAYWDRFDDVPAIGTAVVTRDHPKPSVWTSCGILMGYLPACHHDSIRHAVHHGTVTWAHRGTEPLVRVNLSRGSGDI